MKRLIAKLLGMDLSKPNLHVREDKSEMINTLVKSEMTHVVEFDNVTNGDVVRLEYQHTYNRRTKNFNTSTTEQRPDIVVTITKKNGFVLTYLYDAKYRVQDDVKDGELDEGESIDVADYPLPDAINQMHRYRDAIYYAMKADARPNAKEIIGGYILFPGRVIGDEILNRYFYKSIKKVNIGAFPLLPAANGQEENVVQCDLLEKHLREILLEDSVYEHVKDSIPQKGLVYESETSGNVVVLNIEPEEYEMEPVFLNHTLMLQYIPILIEEGDSLKVDAIDYLVVLVKEQADGYYSVRNPRLKLNKGKLMLVVDVNYYHPFGNGWKQIGKYEDGDIIPLGNIHV